MSPRHKTLAEQLVQSDAPSMACHNFWRSGMVSQPDRLGRTWRRVGDRFEQESGRRVREVCHEGSLLPNLEDPATAGVLRDMIECVRGGPIRWRVEARQLGPFLWEALAFAVRRASDWPSQCASEISPGMRGTGVFLGEAYAQLVLKLRGPF